YSLILAGAVLSILVNPLMFRAIPWFDQQIQRIPALARLLERNTPQPQPFNHTLADHVVVVGLGRVGEHIVRVLQRLHVPHLVIEEDAARAASFQEHGVPTLFGDAANAEVLTHAGLERASALVVT